MSNFIVSAEQAVKILNEAFQADPEAIRRMIYSPVTVNDQIANHPTIQVGQKKKPGRTAIGPDGIFELPSNETVSTLGVIGLLNGIFGIDENGQGPIASLYDIYPDGKEVLAGFCINMNLKPDSEPLNIRYCQRRDKAIDLQTDENNIVSCSTECRNSPKFEDKKN